MPSLDNPEQPSASKTPPKNPERQVHKIVIDRDLCIGAANCMAIAPEAFQLDSENKAVISGTWDEATDEILRQAAAVCPTKAIMLYNKLRKEIKFE